MAIKFIRIKQGKQSDRRKTYTKQYIIKDAKSILGKQTSVLGMQKATNKNKLNLAKYSFFYQKLSLYTF